MFGSLGWGLAMFFVGIALDHSTSFPEHPCGPDAKEKNYTICFATFSVLMGAALITATQITFKYDFPPEPEQSTQEKQRPELSHEDALQRQLAQQLNLPQLADTNSLPLPAKPAPPQLQVSSGALDLGSPNSFSLRATLTLPLSPKGQDLASSSYQHTVVFNYAQILVLGLAGE
jgi:hypothetical protein